MGVMPDWIMAAVMTAGMLGASAVWLAGLRTRQSQIWERLDRIESKVDSLSAALAAQGLSLPPRMRP